jgi:ABC-type glutathione transport system ATPase component
MAVFCMTCVPRPYCTRVGLMSEGNDVEDGDPEEVLHEGTLTMSMGLRQTFKNPAGDCDYCLFEEDVWNGKCVNQYPLPVTTLVPV